MTNDGRGPLAEELRSAAVPARAIIALCALGMVGYAALITWPTISGYEPLALDLSRLAAALATTALWLAVLGTAWCVAGRLSSGGEVFSPQSLDDLKLAFKLLMAIVAVSAGCALVSGGQVDSPALGAACALGVFIACYEYGCILQRQDDETL